MQPGDLTTVIYDRGCLRSGEEWVERNLVPVAAVAVALAVMQVKKFFANIFFTNKLEYFLCVLFACTWLFFLGIHICNCTLLRLTLSRLYFISIYHYFILYFFSVSFSFFPYFFFFFIYIQRGDLSSIINEKGCLLAGEEWLEKNLLVVAGVAVGIAFLQVCIFCDLVIIFLLLIPFKSFISFISNALLFSLQLCFFYFHNNYHLKKNIIKSLIFQQKCL